MFGLFKKKPQPGQLASPEEREAILSTLHPVFRPLDTAFHAFLEVVSANPTWDDNQIEKALCGRGVDAESAGDLVAFAPLAFGREIVEQLGVKGSETYRLHNLVDGSDKDLPLADEPAYAWARQMIDLYRTRERNELFKRVALRSAELAAINKALASGITQDDLVKGTLAPPVVSLRRSIG
jgi:hypothetical protein